MSNHRIGIIGGTGLYNIEGLTHQKWVEVKTPFGEPSDELLTGKLPGATWCFCRAMAAAIASCPAN